MKIGYQHILNLYKNIDILLLKECYALEKIHGTSAHISWKDKQVIFFSGGEKHARFIELFDSVKLKEKFEELFDKDVTIYGEAYGGSQQKMSGTYGKELKFIVFDVKVGDCWLDVPNAHDVATKLGLEFVDYHKIPATIEAVDKERALPSRQAKRNGITEDKIREGVVLRPLIELTTNNGNRLIVKHKNDEFIETNTKREVDPEKLIVLENAIAIANEWVTPMRLSHVLDKLGNPTEMTETKKVISAMIEDVYREAKGEIVESKLVCSAIAKKTVALYKNEISKIQ